MKTKDFWNKMPCPLVNIYFYFNGVLRLHLQNSNYLLKLGIYFPFGTLFIFQHLQVC